MNVSINEVIVNKLTKLDVDILAALQADARLSAQQLADRVGAAATVCWRRVKALTEAGVIRGHHAQLDAAKCGVSEVIFAKVRIANHSGKTVEAFEREVSVRGEVLECYPVMGDADYMLKIAVPNIAAYNVFLQSFLLKVPGIANVESSLALREVKNTHALPVQRYFGMNK
jgi:Lrp/AsnC family transcriptional regulator, leucine-responsive regulatory protein